MSNNPVTPKPSPTNKEKIFSVAMKLFSEKGFDGTSIRQIAQAAEISQGLLYNHYQSKDHLLIEIMGHGMKSAAKIFDVVDSDQPSSLQLATLVKQIYVELQKQEHFWRLFYSLRALPAFHTLLGTEIIEHTAALRAVFQFHYEHMGVQDAERHAYLLYAVVEGIIQQKLMLAESYPLQDVVDDAIKLLILNLEGDNDANDAC